MKYLKLLLLLITIVFTNGFLAKSEEAKFGRLMVAITIDDLPWVGSTAAEESSIMATKRFPPSRLLVPEFHKSCFYTQI